MFVYLNAGNARTPRGGRGRLADNGQWGNICIPLSEPLITFLMRKRGN